MEKLRLRHEQLAGTCRGALLIVGPPAGAGYMVDHALDRGHDVVAVCRGQSVGKLDALRASRRKPLDGADTSIWAAASPELEGATGKFWNKRREIRCRFRSPPQIQKLHAIVEQRLADASSLEASTDDRAAGASRRADRAIGSERLIVDLRRLVAGRARCRPARISRKANGGFDRSKQRDLPPIEIAATVQPHFEKRLHRGVRQGTATDQLLVILLEAQQPIGRIGLRSPGKRR